MTITITSEPAQIASLVGRLDSGAAAQVQSELLAKLDFNQPVILDLGGVDYVSSAGLRTILMICKKSKERCRMFALCCTTSGVDEVLQISGFTKLMPVFASQADAVAQLPEPTV